MERIRDISGLVTVPKDYWVGIPQHNQICRERYCSTIDLQHMDKKMQPVMGRWYDYFGGVGLV